jgi:hypothetical protein
VISLERRIERLEIINGLLNTPVMCSITDKDVKNHRDKFCVSLSEARRQLILNWYKRLEQEV